MNENRTAPIGRRGIVLLAAGLAAAALAVGIASVARASSGGEGKDEGVAALAQRRTVVDSEVSKLERSQIGKLAAWSAPKIPKIHKKIRYVRPAPRVVVLPTTYNQVSAPAAAPAAAPIPAAAPPAPTTTEHDDSASSEGSDG